MTKSDIFIVGIILGGLLLFLLLKCWDRIIRLRYLKRARIGETDAIKLLESEGYKIIGIQERKTIITRINGSPQKNHLTVDIIAKKKGRVYIAEVKTGKKASSPLLAGIRRQLLDYYLAYRPYGRLVVDMEKKLLHSIEFEIIDSKSKRRIFIILVVLVICLAISWWIINELVNGGA